MSVRDVAGLVLTGGASRRLGVDKATLLVDGEPLVERTTRVLTSVASPVVEVGPGYTRDAVREEPAGEGPMAAIAAGARALRDRRVSARATLVLAVDLPLIEPAVLAWLAAHPATGAVVPVVGGIEQPLCARYDLATLVDATELVERGERSMHALLASIPVHRADEREWEVVADARAFTDVDTPEGAAALGVELPR